MRGLLGQHDRPLVAEADAPVQRMYLVVADVGLDDDAADRDENTNEAQMVKKLVRYALACEYARIPIRRDGVRDRGTGSQYLCLHHEGICLTWW